MIADEPVATGTESSLAESPSVVTKPDVSSTLNISPTSIAETTFKLSKDVILTHASNESLYIMTIIDKDRNIFILKLQSDGFIENKDHFVVNELIATKVFITNSTQFSVKYAHQFCYDERASCINSNLLLPFNINVLNSTRKRRHSISSSTVYKENFEKQILHRNRRLDDFLGLMTAQGTKQLIESAIASTDAFSSADHNDVQKLKKGFEDNNRLLT